MREKARGREEGEREEHPDKRRFCRPGRMAAEERQWPVIDEQKSRLMVEMAGTMEGRRSCQGDGRENRRTQKDAEC